jgi:hypothetical protein
MQSSTITYSEQGHCDFDHCKANVRARLLYNRFEIRMCGRHLELCAHCHCSGLGAGLATV